MLKLGLGLHGNGMFGSASFQRLQQIVFDDFNRADSEPTSGDWATVTDYGDTRIVSNMMKAALAGAGSSMSYRTDFTPTDGNQWASCEIGAGQIINYQGVMLRNTNATGGTFYVLWAASATSLAVWRWTAGTSLLIKSWTVTTIVPGDVLRLETEGPDCGVRLSAYINDVQVESTEVDSASPLTAKGTWASHTLERDTEAAIDNFRAGNILYQGTTPPTFDAVGSAFVENGTSTVSWSHVMSAGAKGGVFVWVAWDSTTESISGVTYDGVAMTAMPGGSHVYNTHTTGSWYYAVAPASGSKTVEVTMSGGNHLGVAGSSVSFTGVDQTTPFADPVTFDTFQTAIDNCAFPKGPSGLIVDGTCAVWSGVATTLTVGANQTERLNFTSTYVNAGVSTEPVATYDGTQWTLGASKDAVNVAFTLRGQ